MWAPAAESAGGAQGRPCILHQPPSFRSQNWPDGFGLQSYLGAGPERWKGRAEAWSWGQGLLGPPSAPGVWEPGLSSPSPGPPGRAASELG